MLIDAALQYAARGWRVFPLHTTVTGACSCGRDCGRDAGKHPRTPNGVKDATIDRATIERWWQRWPDANIGLATGSGLVVLDLDLAEEIGKFQAIAAQHGGLPPTLTGKTGRGLHIYLAGDLPGSRKVDGLLVRGEGGYVVAPPSLHASGQYYQWVVDLPLAPMPDWFRDWVQTTGNPNNYTVNNPTVSLGAIPAYLSKSPHISQSVSQYSSTTTAAKAAAALKTPWSHAEQARIASALAAIPASCDRDTWLHIGMALHELDWSSGPEGGDLGFALWQAWSETGGEKYQGLHDLETRWRSFGKPGRGGITLGSLYFKAEQHGWAGNAPRAAPEAHAGVNGAVSAEAVLPASMTTLGPAHAAPNHESPLIHLNEKYSVIGDVGGKCLVLGWVPSKVDEVIRVPSFQAFRAFSERYASQYVMVRKQKGDDWIEEQAQLGATWLKWRRRKSFEGIDLVPNGAAVLPGNLLNLWHGFAVEPKAGSWDMMQAHIARVMAAGEAKSLEYILKWAAWSVQNPGERAEVALVFRGEKGSGKGTFANALKKIFGQHGLQIFNSKHLVGAFNGHLRNCLLLFADEAFWAGDKQGESTLKGMLTEPALMIEQKGVDAAPWKNRLHVIMAANAEWVVPTSHDERRYAVFDVDNSMRQDKRYFNALYAERDSGGLAAMLFDLLRVDLKGWHPREVVQTKGLMRQKERSLDPRHEWWEDVLQNGRLPMQNDSMLVATQTMVGLARDAVPKLKDISANAIGRFLRDFGCLQIHRTQGNFWRVPELGQARANWDRKFGAWNWRTQAELWNEKRG